MALIPIVLIKTASNANFVKFVIKKRYEIGKKQYL